MAKSKSKRSRKGAKRTTQARSIVAAPRYVPSAPPPRPTALVVSAPKPMRRRARAHHRPAHGAGLLHLAGATLVLNSVAGSDEGFAGKTVYGLAQKIPGAKTIGGPAAAGLVLGAIGKYTHIGGPKLKPWLKAAGVVGVVLAITKAMTTKDFKWLGDGGEIMDADV